MVSKRSMGKFTHKFISLTILSMSLASLAGCNGGGVTPDSSAGSGSGGSTGGGGTTVTASPNILFSSGYISYSAQTNGAYLHSAQSGDVYTGFGGKLIYGQYSSSQGDMNRTGLYVLQAQASAAATSASDYAYVAMLAPGDGVVDISQAATLLIQMGNSITPGTTGGNANVFTVDINNASGTTAATGDCSYDQTLTTVGNNVNLSALGARNYAIPVSSVTCSVGSLATLQSSGITTVAVKIVGSKNPAIVQGEFDTLVVGNIGFTGSMKAADITTLNTL